MELLVDSGSVILTDKKKAEGRKKNNRKRLNEQRTKQN